MDDMNSEEVKKLELLDLIYESYMMNKEAFNIFTFNSFPIPKNMKEIMITQYRTLQKYGYKDLW